MKIMKKTLIIGVGLLGVGAGGWYVMQEIEKPAEVQQVIKMDSLSPELKVINEGTRPEVIVNIYRELKEREYLDESGELKTDTIDKALAMDSQIYNYAYPAEQESKQQTEPEMMKLLSELLSRQDGSTNEVEDVSYRIVEKETFQTWETLFKKWSTGEINEETLKNKWLAVSKTIPDARLTAPFISKIEFPHSNSAVEMMDFVLAEIESDGGSTAPHISFVSVDFHQDAGLYTLYYAESHIE